MKRRSMVQWTRQVGQCWKNYGVMKNTDSNAISKMILPSSEESHKINNQIKREYNMVNRRNKKMMELLQGQFEKYESLKKEKVQLEHQEAQANQERLDKEKQEEAKKMKKHEQGIQVVSLDELISTKVQHQKKSIEEEKKKKESEEHEDPMMKMKHQELEKKVKNFDRKVIKRVNISDTWGIMTTSVYHKIEGNKKETEGRRLKVSFLGLPNTGKSTFLNRMLNTKISGESRKSCFTRTAIEGVQTMGNTQIVYVDTPGIVSKEENESLYNSTKKLARVAVKKVSRSDMTLVFFDGVHQLEKSKHLLMILEALKTEMPNHRFVAVINKIDLVHPHTRVLALMDRLVETKHFERVFMVSAQTNTGMEEVKQYLKKESVAGNLYYPDNITTTAAISTLCLEVIREAVFSTLHYEIPYKINYQAKGSIQEVHRVGGDVEIHVPLTFVVPTKSIGETLKSKFYPIAKYATKELQKHYFKDREVKLNFNILVKP